MTAQVIQFGKPRDRGRAVKQPRKLPMPAEQTDAKAERLRMIKKELVAVRFTVDGKLYEALFDGSKLSKVKARALPPQAVSTGPLSMTP